MLPKQYRLKNQKAFDATYKNHKIVSDSVLIIYTGKQKKSPDTLTRYGFVVSKKFHKRSTKRNRIKRLMRECVRLGIKENKLKQLNSYMSFIVMPRNNPDICKAKLSDIQKSFYKLIERIK